MKEPSARSHLPTLLFVGIALSTSALTSCAGTGSTEPTSVARAETTNTAPSRPASRVDTPPPVGSPPNPMSSATADSKIAVPQPVLHAPTADELAAYTWLDGSTQVRSLVSAIPTPSGFTRVSEDPASFGAWLRTLPLRGPYTQVKSYAGSVLHEGDDHRIAAVAEIDVGTADLQQCADSVIRMHAEWQWSRGAKSDIGYHFLSGDYATWQRWSAGERPVADGNKVVWKNTAKPSDSRATFRKYLDSVFNYASTISLALHTEHVERADVAPGDFFVFPGGPGHAVLVLDVAKSANGHTVALLGQGYMPAQDFQVLRPNGSEGVWFSLDGDAVDTPFWEPFPWSALHRFSPHGATK